MKSRTYLYFIGIFTLFIFAACDNNAQKKAISAMNFNELNEVLKSDSTNALALHYRSFLLANSGNYVAAIADLSKAFILVPDSQKSYYLTLSDWNMRQGQMAKAIDLLSTATTKYPDYTLAWIKLGEINLIFKKYDDAFANANQALNTDPYSDKAFFLKAYCYKEMGDTLKAANQFQQCLKNNPNHYEANIELGIIYMNKKDALSEKYFQNAIAIDSSRIDGWYDLGMYYQQNDMLNEAIETYKNLGKINPLFPHSFFNIGYIYMQMLNIPDQGIPYYKIACDIKPDYFEAWFNLGLSYERTGDINNAKIAYKKALEINPNYTAAIEALTRIKS